MDQLTEWKAQQGSFKISPGKLNKLFDLPDEVWVADISKVQDRFGNEEFHVTVMRIP